MALQTFIAQDVGCLFEVSREAEPFRFRWLSEWGQAPHKIYKEQTCPVFGATTVARFQRQRRRLGGGHQQVRKVPQVSMEVLVELAAAPAFPLTLMKIKNVAAILKERKYRSASQMLSVAQAQHILEGHAWSTLRSLTVSGVRRSVLRGRAPPRQARVFRWAKIIVVLRVAPQPALEGKRVRRPAKSVTLGSHLLLRLDYL